MENNIKPLTIEEIKLWKMESIQELEKEINIAENRNILRLIATIEELNKQGG